MNTDSFHTFRLRRIKWITTGLAAFFIALVDVVYYYYLKNVPLRDDIIDWLIGMVIALTLIEIAFREIAKLQACLQQEISKRKQAEEALRQREKKYRELSIRDSLTKAL